jgi:hypothetical protein
VRALRAVGLAGLLVAGLAGCLRVDADLSIERDTVNGTVITALDRDAAQQLELDPDDLFADQTTGLASLDGVTTEPYDEQGWTGSRMVFDRVSIDELNRLSEGDPEGLRIVHDAGRYEFSLVVDFSFLAELDEKQLATDPAAPDVDIAELLATFDVTIAVTFPGEVTEHNGSLSGTTVTWNPPPGERTELRAIAVAPDAGGPSEPGETGDGTQPPAPASTAGGGSSSTGWWLALAVLAAVAVGGGVAAGLIIQNRRNRSANADVE